MKRLILVLFALAVLCGTCFAFPPSGDEAMAKASEFVEAYSGDNSGLDSGSFAQFTNADPADTATRADSWSSGAAFDVLGTHVAFETGVSRADAMDIDPTGASIAEAYGVHSSTALVIPQKGIAKTSSDAKIGQYTLGDGEAASMAAANALVSENSAAVSGCGSAQADIKEHTPPFLMSAPYTIHLIQ